MYNVKRVEGGAVVITEAGNGGQEIELEPATIVTYRPDESGYIEMKRVKDFGSDIELLQAIARKVRI